MKNILTWFKKHWVVVVSGLVMLGSLPTAWYFSDSWNKKIQKTQEAAAKKDLSSITQTKVNYTVAPIFPGQGNIEMSYAPNDELTKRFVAIKEQLAQQSQAVIARMTDFNRGKGDDARAVGRAEHALLAPELFPGPSRAEIRKSAFPGKDDNQINNEPAERRRALEEKARQGLTEAGRRAMEDKLLAKGTNPDPFGALIAAANAGAPPSPSSVLQTVTNLVQREREKMVTTNRQLTPEEQQKLNDLAQKLRLGAYQHAAEEVSFYMARSAFGNPAPAPAGGAQGPVLRPIASEASIGKPSRDRDLFMHQWDLWVFSDVLAAVKGANTRDGRPTKVEDSVVKRIERIAVYTIPGLDAEWDQNIQRDGNGQVVGAAQPAAPGAEVKPDYRASVTGRINSPANPDYDVRTATIVAVVSSDRLPLFVDALTRSNFNTLVEVRLTAVDVKSDLERGFYYGPEHVVRATITLETVWLRTWTAPLMPASIKDALNLQDSRR